MKRLKVCCEALIEHCSPLVGDKSRATRKSGLLCEQSHKHSKSNTTCPVLVLSVMLSFNFREH